MILVCQFETLEFLKFILIEQKKKIKKVWKKTGEKQKKMYLE